MNTVRTMAYKRRATKRKYIARRKYGGKRRSAPRRRLQPPGYSMDLAGNIKKLPSYGLGNAPSAVQVANRPKSKYGQIVRVSENASLSSTRYGYPMSRVTKLMYRKSEGRRTFYSNNATSLLTLTGRQSLGFFNALGQGELATIKTTLDPTAGTNNLKIFLGYIKQKVTFKNQSNHVACLTMYDLNGRRVALSSSLDSPIEAWEKGISDMGGGTAQPYIPNSTPFQSPEFRRLFNTIKVTKIYLEPGETHEHTIYRRINRVYNSTVWDNQTLGVVPGITSLLFYTVYGSIGHEATTGDTNPATVTYMPCRIDMIHQWEFNAAVVPASQPSYSTTTNLITTAPVNWDFMAEAGDVDGDCVNA